MTGPVRHVCNSCVTGHTAGTDIDVVDERNGPGPQGATRDRSPLGPPGTIVVVMTSWLLVPLPRAHDSRCRHVRYVLPPYNTCELVTHSVSCMPPRPRAAAVFRTVAFSQIQRRFRQRVHRLRTPIEHNAAAIRLASVATTGAVAGVRVHSAGDCWPVWGIARVGPR